MQVKKDEVKFAILNNAQQEFYKHGFEKASIRKIVKASGTTIGNFYNYFENKEALFDDVVREEYLSFKYFIQFHDQIETPDDLFDLTDPKEWRKALAQMLPMLTNIFSNKFVILIECSLGTKYETSRKAIVDLVIGHFEDHIKQFNPNYEIVGMGEVLAEQLINGIIHILRKYNEDEKEKNKMLIEFLVFYFIGSMALMSEV